ncbi:dihydrodipicolinate synthase family protein [Streptococcus pneumoniae]|uniref:dihydrodipicolinate synthase family protein n=1 Tax=Streptococcus pneumoniae TaxID=1313 RepID=UPI0010246FF2|nr:dihydrodipicolinate synthase family protein [Streptococcus pneumoniae]VFH91335.1 N-acetylneuraminate lyase [Streptococcus pneumoniae]
MSDLKKYEGVIPAFYACYDDQGEVSPERTRALVQYFIDKGVQGLYVNGSSGECIYQSVEDRKLISEMLKNPRVIGVKNSSMPVQDIQTFVSLGGEDHIVFNGPDEQFLGGRLMGAKAGIGGTYGAMPELFLKLNQLIADKDLETARELQYAINAIIGKLTSAHGNMYGVIKEVLKINEGLNIGSVRSPLTPVTEEDRPVVEAAAALIRETKERFL